MGSPNGSPVDCRRPRISKDNHGLISTNFLVLLPSFHPRRLAPRSALRSGTNEYATFWRLTPRDALQNGGGPPVFHSTELGGGSSCPFVCSPTALTNWRYCNKVPVERRAASMSKLIVNLETPGDLSVVQHKHPPPSPLTPLHPAGQQHPT